MSTRNTTTTARATRSTRNSAREIAELRSEVAELRSILASHAESLCIHADCLETCAQVLVASTQESPKETAQEKPRKSGHLHWSDLSREGKKSWNAYAFRSKTYGRSKDAWKRWSTDRLTMEFPRDIV